MSEVEARCISARHAEHRATVRNMHGARTLRSAGNGRRSTHGNASPLALFAFCVRRSDAIAQYFVVFFFVVILVVIVLIGFFDGALLFVVNIELLLDCCRRLANQGRHVLLLWGRDCVQRGEFTRRGRANLTTHCRRIGAGCPLEEGAAETPSLVNREIIAKSLGYSRRNSKGGHSEPE